MRILGLLFAAIVGVGALHSAAADQAGDAQAGEALAIRLCSQCHAMPARIAEGQGNPLPGRSFLEIAKGEKAAPETLWSFLRTAHNSVSHPGNMPSQDLTGEQIRLISAYLAALRAAK